MISCTDIWSKNMKVIVLFLVTITCLVSFCLGNALHTLWEV